MMPHALPRLVADATLGKLMTHLRLCGFDTLFDRGVPDARRLERLSEGDRIILTRCQRVWRMLGHPLCLFVDDDHPLAQIRQVLLDLNVRPIDLKPLSRCCRCNDLLETVPKMEVAGCVADYVWQSHKHFKKCRSCGRIYWAGSHTQRWVNQMNQWF